LPTRTLHNVTLNVNSLS